MKDTKKQTPKKPQNKKSAKPVAKGKTTKKQKLTRDEKKIYLLVALGIFSVCAFLLTVSFFLFPKFSTHMSKSTNAPIELQAQTETEPQTTDETHTEIKPSTDATTERNSPRDAQAELQQKRKAETETQRVQPKLQPQSKKQKPVLSTEAETQTSKTRKVQPVTQESPSKRTPKPQPTVPNQNRSNTSKQVQPSEPTKPKQAIVPSKSQEKTEATKQVETYKPSKLTKKAGVLVFVFDDAGHNFYQLEKFLKLPFKCTFAVLPGLPNSKTIAQKIRSAGHEVILHQPMQALNLNLNPGPKAVTGDMTLEEVRKLVAENLAEIAPVKGINNHEGSLVTSREDLMKEILQLVKEKQLIFLDSRTNSETVVPKVATELGVSFFERNIFLDNSKKSEDMRTQLEEGMKYASKNGRAILIGHIFTVELAELLTKMYKEILDAGFEIQTLSELNR